MAQGHHNARPTASANSSSAYTYEMYVQAGLLTSDASTQVPILWRLLLVGSFQCQPDGGAHAMRAMNPGDVPQRTAKRAKGGDGKAYKHHPQ